MSFGVMEALLSFFRRQVGLRTDTASAGGSLHGKIADMRKRNLLHAFLPGIISDIFGDGSLGDVTISANTTLNEFVVYQYNKLSVNSGITLIAHRAVICVKDTLTVNGLISASGKGASGGCAPTLKNGANGYGYAGGGGAGGMYNYAPVEFGGAGGSTLKPGGIPTYAPTPGGGFSAGELPVLTSNRGTYITEACGGGGGAGYDNECPPWAEGGSGGGNLLVFANKITITGAIRADGLDGNSPRTNMPYYAGGGGGGGGCVLIVTTSDINDAVITANGGLAAPVDAESHQTKGSNGGDGLVLKVVV